MTSPQKQWNSAEPARTIGLGIRAIPIGAKVKTLICLSMEYLEAYPFCKFIGVGLAQLLLEPKAAVNKDGGKTIKVIKKIKKGVAKRFTTANWGLIVAADTMSVAERLVQLGLSNFEYSIPIED